MIWESCTSILFIFFLNIYVHELEEVWASPITFGISGGTSGGVSYKCMSQGEFEQPLHCGCPVIWRRLLATRQHAVHFFNRLLVKISHYHFFFIKARRFTFIISEYRNLEVGCVSEDVLCGIHSLLHGFSEESSVAKSGGQNIWLFDKCR